MHHLSYARLGAEWDVDLEVLCRPCHEGHHFDEDRRQHLGIYVKLAAEAIHADQGATSLDLKADVRDRCRRLQIPANDRRIGDALDALLTRRLRMPATASVAQQPTPTDRPFTDTEAKAICRRLGIRVPFKSISAARWCDPDDFARQEAVRRELDIERY